MINLPAVLSAATCAAKAAHRRTPWTCACPDCAVVRTGPPDLTGLFAAWASIPDDPDDPEHAGEYRRLRAREVDDAGVAVSVAFEIYMLERNRLDLADMRAQIAAGTGREIRCFPPLPRS